jgi:peptidoglycan hydrolase-like amidase
MITGGSHLRILVLGLAFLVATLTALPPQPAHAQQGSRTFPETGFSVGGAFLRFFERNGGLDIFGFPITPEITEGGRTVQYFQRARFEYYPEHAGTRYEVQLGLLGDALTAGRSFPRGEPFPPSADHLYFPETGYGVHYAFLRFFLRNGGIDIFGYPISEELQEGGFTVQYFQRARFEYRPDLPERYRVSLGLLGVEYLERQQPRALYTPGELPGTLQPGATYRLPITVTNTGLTRWPAGGDRPVRLSYHWLDAAGRLVVWDGARTDLPRDLAPGESIALSALVVAPAQPGAYLLQWDLLQENVAWFSTRGVPAPTLPVQVGALPPPAPAGGPLGPILRVGVYSTTDSSIRISATGPFVLLDPGGAVLARFGPRQVVQVERDTQNQLRVTAPGAAAVQTGKVARFAPEGANSFLQVEDMPQYNRFRGLLEVQYSTVSERLWAINELTTEEYLLGIGEEPESFPYQGLKAAVVAFRSYALAVKQRWERIGKEPFHLVSSLKWVEPYVGANQWYIGQYRETLGPNLTRAVQETRGQVLTYNGTIAITPYFSVSDGRLRSWAEVWGGDGYPWLPGGPDPYCDAGELRGHGVGMCMVGARERARNGATYEQILAFYYPGTVLTRLY